MRERGSLRELVRGQGRLLRQCAHPAVLLWLSPCDSTSSGAVHSVMAAVVLKMLLSNSSLQLPQVIMVRKSWGAGSKLDMCHLIS